MIVFDASSIVGALLKPDSVPERAFLHALDVDTLAMSAPVLAELSTVLVRPKFARFVSPTRLQRFLEILRHESFHVTPREQIVECRDPNDDKYLELVVASGANIAVTSDLDLLTMDPWRGTRLVRPAAYLAMVAT